VINLDQLLSNNISEFSTVNRKNLDDLVSLVEELVINKVRIEKMKNECSNKAQTKILGQELRIISDIQESIKKVRLVKMKTIDPSLTDLVNRCCKKYNINAELSFKGQETEIENSLINYIHNILIYFIKDICLNEFNAIANSHNIIKIQASSDGKNLTTIIESNGKGFDNAAICKKMNKETIDFLSLNDDEVKVFLDFTNSTSQMEELYKLRSDLLYLEGSIKLESVLDEYRRITIGVPLSSSIMQGLLVKIGDQVYAIPLEYIETIMNKDVVNIENLSNTEVVIYRENVIQLKRVSDLLDIHTTNESSCILVVSMNNKRIALLVDSLLDQTDMVIKPKHPIIKDIHEIKGTTILGDGLVTLVLDIPSILKEI
jgi:two-component system, chemotaxis family, sensor kinase CheA